ncbi:MAG: cation:proton antiporter regulatory subunit, partial [Bacteroidia bacterium]
AAISHINEAYSVIGDSNLIGTSIKIIKNNFHDEDISIIGVVRGKSIYINPPDDFTIQMMDMILIFGKQNKMDEAVEILDNFNNQ